MPDFSATRWLAILSTCARSSMRPSPSAWKPNSTTAETASVMKPRPAAASVIQ